MPHPSGQIALLGLFFIGMTLPPLPAQTPAKPAADLPPVRHPRFPSGQDTPLGEAVRQLLADPAVARASWGIAVTALDGTPLFGLEEGKLFRPASNAKLFTTAAALALLGPQSVVTTTVRASAPAAEGVLHGDLTLAGAGDANLSGLPFPYTPVPGETPASPTPLLAIDDLAAQVAAHGVQRITGDVLGDDSVWAWEPYPQSWAIDDMVWGYGAPVSSLSVNDSLITLTVQSGAHPGDPATLVQSPDVGFYTLQASVTTGAPKSPSAVHVQRAVGSRTVVVTGTIAPGGKLVEQLGVSDPPLFAAMALKQRLQARGVVVQGEARSLERPAILQDSFARQSREPLAALPGHVTALPPAPACSHPCPVTLATRTSPTLEQNVLYTMKESQNLHAEMLLRQLGSAWATDGSLGQGARVVRQFLLNAGLDGNDFIFFDGSGLGDHDMVTPRATAALLAYARSQPWFAPWKASLPIGGVDGTLAGRFQGTPLQGHVFAKTGTLGESRALSGYLDCASGHQVIFSVMVDNHSPIGSADRTTMDKLLAAIAANE